MVSLRSDNLLLICRKHLCSASGIFPEQVSNQTHGQMNKIVFGSFVLLVLTGLFAGCGQRTAPEGQLSGRVLVDGSSTVYPITEAVAEEFMKTHPGVQVLVGISGTGGGFKKFLRKETDINNASRPIKPAELELARKNGVAFIELPVAYDAIAVVVNPKNDWVDCLTVEELRRIWEPGSKVEYWDDVRPEFPHEPIHLYGPGTDSGTYDYFTAAIVGEEGASRPDFTASEDDNVLVQGVSGDPYALGYFGLAYYMENKDKLKAISIDDGNPDNGDGCIPPSVETVISGTYQPLSRPVFIYVRADRADDPAVEAFVEFYLTHAKELVTEVGYVPLSDEAYALALERFRKRITGSIFEGMGSVVGIHLEDLLKKEIQQVEGDQ